MREQRRRAEPQTAQVCADAMLAHVAGRFGAARRHYEEAVAQMRRDGSLHADGFRELAQLAVDLSEGRAAEAESAARALHELAGPLAAEAWAVTLAATGQTEQARAARTAVMPLRPDFFYSILATFRAMAVIAVGDRPAAQALAAELLPIKDMLAGAASISLVMQPVAQTLGELSVFLGRPEEAAGPYRG